jgi:hypothetical protein
MLSLFVPNIYVPVLEEVYEDATKLWFRFQNDVLCVCRLPQRCSVYAFDIDTYGRTSSEIDPRWEVVL